MIRLITVLIPSVMFFCSNIASSATTPVNIYAKSTQSLVEAKIVGGEEADTNDWPWMSAYVDTFEGADTSLVVNGVNYDTESFTEGATGQASGEIINCGIGNTVCAEATGKVCLIERGDIDFSDKADNCQAGGGIGAIIYNNEEQGNISGTLGQDYTGTIPVVAVTRDDGLALLELVGTLATVSATSELQQDAACGGSFIGDKWVITAAHCVADGSTSFLKMNVGEYDLSDGAENAIDIANVFIHPDYDSVSFNNDIALVELTESVDVEAVKIAEPEVTDQYAIENSIATVAGWGGRVGYEPGVGETSDFPDILHEVDLQLMTNQECIDTLNDSTGFPITDSDVTSNMICASIPEGGKGSCQGDSGGPLIINTGTGPEQVGIVSWGYGCAAEGYPDVYTRVSEYIDWINSITGGVTIASHFNFPIMFVSDTQTEELTVSNNSVSTVSLTFESSGSDSISLDTSECTSLEPNTSCQLSVTFAPTTLEDLNAEIVISTDDPNIAANSAILSGITLDISNTIGGLVGETSTSVAWFSGGSENRVWTSNTTEGIESGAIGDSQESILVALVDGEGEFSFEWAVSSEENTDEETAEIAPYDALFLYVNGELETFISGEVEFSEYSIDLPAGTNIIFWVYSKDINTLDGQDKGFIRNVTFTPPVVIEEEMPSDGSSSSGGSLGWLTLCIISVIAGFRRKPI